MYMQPSVRVHNVENGVKSHYVQAAKSTANIPAMAKTTRLVQKNLNLKMMKTIPVHSASGNKTSWKSKKSINKKTVKT